MLQPTAQTCQYNLYKVVQVCTYCTVRMYCTECTTVYSTVYGTVTLYSVQYCMYSTLCALYSTVVSSTKYQCVTSLTCPLDNYHCHYYCHGLSLVGIVRKTNFFFSSLWSRARRSAVAFAPLLATYSTRTMDVRPIKYVT